MTGLYFWAAVLVAMALGASLVLVFVGPMVKQAREQLEYWRACGQMRVAVLAPDGRPLVDGTVEEHRMMSLYQGSDGCELVMKLTPVAGDMGTEVLH